MADTLGTLEPPRTLAARSRRFKAHEIELADGGRLVLAVDGSIHHIDDHGSAMHTWALDDPAWPHHAIRFGLRPQTPTVRPQGGRVQGTKPPRR